MRTLTLTAVLSLALGASPVQARDRAAGPVTFDDIMALRAVGAPVLSPDGRAVLFTVRGWEPGPDGRQESRTHVWRSATSAGAVPRQLTSGDRGEQLPRWSPDGTLMAFVAVRPTTPSEEDPKGQIWVMPVDGGEAWRVTDLSEAVTAYAWSPDSTQIAFTAREPTSEDETSRRKRRDDAQVFEVDARPIHLWAVDVATRMMTALTPSMSLSLRGEPSWSADSRQIAFAAAPTSLIRDDRVDVHVLTIATRDTQKITMDIGPDTSPIWSPDGRTIAFLAQSNPGKPNGDGIPFHALRNQHLMLYHVAERRMEDASADFDLSPADLLWVNGGSRLLFTAGTRAYRDVFSYDLVTRRYAQLTRDRTITLGAVDRQAELAAFTMDSPIAPSDVYVSDLSFGAPRKISTVNPQTATFTLGETEVVTWKSDGHDIEGLLLKPVGYQPGRKYPLLVVAHGGPTGAYTNTFRVGYGDGGQHWAGQGWAVLYPNPRGSTNYGEAFMRANIGDWGGGDYRDLMAGVDDMIRRGVADPDKLAFEGWSYGGYLTCWVVSQTTRFRAAMMGAGLSNLYSMYGTNDISNYLGTFFGGMPSTETIPLYAARSGLTFVDRVTTPLLILHGGSDERVPTGQSYEFYRALKDRGKTVELVTYPREGHGISEYYHQLDRLRRQYDWITKYTLGDAARKSTTP